MFKKLFIISFVLLSFSAFSDHVIDNSRIGPHLSAEGRLERMKEIFEAEPDFKIDTKHEAILYDFFLPDMRFIVNKVAKERCARTKQMPLLADLLVFVGKEWGNEISLQDYNAIGQFFARLLSIKGTKTKLSVAGFFKEYKAEIEKRENLPIEEGFTSSNLPTEFSGKTNPIHDYIGSPYMPVPVVSETGEVPIHVMNEGWGFIVGDRVRSVDFLAVGTDEKLSFDSFRDADSYQGYLHDYAHLNLAGRMKAKYNYEKYSRKTLEFALFKISLDERYSSSPEATLKVRLAFFDCFHESAETLAPIKRDITRRLIKTREKQANLSGQTYLYYSNPRNLRQEEAYLEAAKAMGLNFMEEFGNLREAYDAYLAYLIEGYFLLLKCIPSLEDLFKNKALNPLLEKNILSLNEKLESSLFEHACRDNLSNEITLNKVLTYHEQDKILGMLNLKEKEIFKRFLKKYDFLNSH